MNFTQKNYIELETIKNKIDLGSASLKEKQRFLELLEHFDRDSIIEYVNSIGFSSLEEFKATINKQKANSDLLIGLCVLGGAILLAYLVNKK